MRIPRRPKRNPARPNRTRRPSESDGDEAAESTDPSGMRYRKQRRGGKGLRDIRTSERNGPVVGVAPSATATTSCSSPRRAWSTARNVHEIRIIGRNTQGVRIMNLNEGDKIVTVAKVASETAVDATTDNPVS